MNRKKPAQPHFYPRNNASSQRRTLLLNVIVKLKAYIYSSDERALQLNVIFKLKAYICSNNERTVY
jgi:hypothetical protein